MVGIQPQTASFHLAKMVDASAVTVEKQGRHRYYGRSTPNGDVRNSDQERHRLLKEIINQETWIVEGAHHKWVSESFEKADLIIYISPSKFSRDIRVFTIINKTLKTYSNTLSGIRNMTS